MGIPSFYRWLVERYPLAVVDVVEESPIFINGAQIPVDSSRPNPNDMEFDNLYLDMNGIIHPCFHPEGQPAPNSYEEVFKAVFKYIDRVFTIVRPRKLLYLAIDGVAPRAKMNQQRARRFRAAKDAAEAAATGEMLRNVFEAEGKKLHGLESDKLDSNIITPGTEFMSSLSSALQYYIHLRMNSDPGWTGIKVILSDASVVGEGEHKIMSYIRLQRNCQGFDPNTRHCLYGLDADLIMLALATHEIHFSILREDVRNPRQNMETSHRGKGSRRTDRVQGVNMESNDYISKQKFQFFNIWILRDYLSHEMKIPDPTVSADMERLMDDFVFMCLLIGNDFLPHVPSLEISEGAIDLLMTVYKQEFIQMGGYLTDSFKMRNANRQRRGELHKDEQVCLEILTECISQEKLMKILRQTCLSLVCGIYATHKVNLKRVQHFMRAVGFHEDPIFRKRRQVLQGRNTRYPVSNAKRGSTESYGLKLCKKRKSEAFWSSSNLTQNSTDQPAPCTDAKELQHAINTTTKDGANDIVDNIKLGEEGWKERFYAEKFEAKTEDECEKIRKHAVLKYIEGMCWVMHYYYEGVCSWQWFYPYHYAPFASDFYDIEHLEILFTPGRPFKPFDQLMGVLPPASAHALPLRYRELMTDPSSPILDLYPSDFELDMNGKRHEWQAICKLPFLEESRLLAEIAKVEDSLTEEEKRRNSLGMDLLFVHIKHPLASEVIVFFERNKDHPKLSMIKVKRQIDPKFSDGMNGFMYISDIPVLRPEISSLISDMDAITRNQVITVFYRLPTSHPHIPRPPQGVFIPKMAVRKEDTVSTSLLWYEKSGFLDRVSSEKVIPNAISGPSLEKLAHGLVLKYYVDKRKENVDPKVFDRLVAKGVPPARPTQPNSNPEKQENTDPPIQPEGDCPAQPNSNLEEQENVYPPTQPPEGDTTVQSEGDDTTQICENKDTNKTKRDGGLSKMCKRRRPKKRRRLGVSPHPTQRNSNLAWPTQRYSNPTKKKETRPNGNTRPKPESGNASQITLVCCENKEENKKESDGGPRTIRKRQRRGLYSRAVNRNESTMSVGMG